ncbi:hypothetical protein MD484_g286, partial [Candolleomyces efflorescens]
MMGPALLDHWSNSRLSQEETPLNSVSDRITHNPTSYTIQRSAEYRGIWQLWDVETDTAVVATHAFVVDFASDLKTGNFVPDGERPPNNMLEYQCKREPSMLAQVSIAFDTREDMSNIEDWLVKIPDFNTLKKPRSTWMSPRSSNELNHHRYIVNSPLFQKRTAFNCPDGKYTVNYEVHPWIAKHCVPHDRSWIPNPTLVSILDGQTETLLNIDDVPSSDLDTGDIVKMKFKITFSVNRVNWSTNLVPLQIIRVGRTDSTVQSTPNATGDNDDIVLLKPGQKLHILKDPVPTEGVDTVESPPWGSIKDEDDEITMISTEPKSTPADIGASGPKALSDYDNGKEGATAGSVSNKGRKAQQGDGERRKRTIKGRK